jgi:hypothetical protein
VSLLSVCLCACEWVKERERRDERREIAEPRPLRLVFVCAPPFFFYLDRMFCPLGFRETGAISRTESECRTRGSATCVRIWKKATPRKRGGQRPVAQPLHYIYFFVACFCVRTLTRAHVRASFIVARGHRGEALKIEEGPSRQ